MRHGGQKRRCSHNGCENLAKNGDVCIRHGALRPTCDWDGCDCPAYKKGACWRHQRTALSEEGSDLLADEADLAPQLSAQHYAGVDVAPQLPVQQYVTPTWRLDCLHNAM